MDIERHEFIVKRLTRIEKLLIEILARDLAKNAQDPLVTEMDRFGKSWRADANNIGHRDAP